MSTQTPTDLESSGIDYSDPASLPDDNEELKKIICDLAQNQIQQQEQLNEQQNTIEQQQEELDEKDERIDELEEYRAQNEKEKAQIRSDVHETSEDSDRNFNIIDTLNQKYKNLKGEVKNVSSGRSGLEQILQLPSSMAKEVLSKNQNRAREFVRSLDDVKTTHASKGIVVESPTVKRWLRDRCNNGYDQTVSRMMDFIDELGEEYVEVKKHKGRRIIVIEPEYVSTLCNVEEVDEDTVDDITQVVRPNTTTV